MKTNRNRFINSNDGVGFITALIYSLPSIPITSAQFIVYILIPPIFSVMPNVGIALTGLAIMLIPRLTGSTGTAAICDTAHPDGVANGYPADVGTHLGDHTDHLMARYHGVYPTTQLITRRHQIRMANPTVLQCQSNIAWPQGSPLNSCAGQLRAGFRQLIRYGHILVLVYCAFDRSDVSGNCANAIAVVNLRLIVAVGSSAGDRRSHYQRVRFTIATSDSITGTSTRTPTTVARAAPE